MADTIIEHGTVITMDPARRVIEDGAVAVQGGRIVAVGTTAEVAASHPHAARRIDARHKAVLPGFIDGHTHAGHAMVRTAGGGDSKAWYDTVHAIYNHGSGPEFWRLEAAMAATERLRFGTTTAVALMGGGDSAMRCDDLRFVDVHCQAVESVGVREIVVVGHPRGPFPADYSIWEGETRHRKAVPFETFRDVCAAAVDTWHGGAEGRLRIALLSPVHHAGSPPELAEETFAHTRAMRELSRAKGVMFHQDGHRTGSIATLQEQTGALGEDVWLSHCIDITDHEMRLLADSGTRVAHNASANFSIRGRCPAPELIDMGVLVMLSTDATAPDRSADQFRNMWQCMHYHRRHFRDDKVMPVGKVLEMVTIDAAKALHLDHEIGSLEVGKKADIITVDLFKPHMMPLHMPVHRVVCFAQGSDVSEVMVDGKLLVENSQILDTGWRDMLRAVQAEAEAAIRRTGTQAAFEALPPTFWGHTHY
ncbi:amidohydrolase family protein [Roseomonas haemaphysalidis]|uniref:Amidohydrolase family protein n=1 Tax=Roseomonas haemaphysalidis TaxID=2768162 RepID=A0ABS3KVL7_9PROT|nr:amidohydrolase family protein [Roseomonas haemaphysalidis]MBO1080658.1 amidohydrolase family protein [Roseomonas haemaphysalidis]